MSKRVAVRVVGLLFFVTFIVPLPGADAQFAPGTRVHRSASAPRTRGLSAPLDAPSAPTIGTPYHNGATLQCSDCHTMHFSESHDLAGATPAGGIGLGSSPTGKLLRRTSALDLCLACHDGRAGIPDVVGSDSNGLVERAAGFFATPETANFRGHTLQRDPDGVGGDLCSRCHFVGSMGTAGVTCVDCHAKHGNGNYRNLQWASWPGGEPAIIALTNPSATGMARYERANIAYPGPSGAEYREVTNMCIDCHHSFFMDPTYTGIASPYHRHPGTNTEWGYRAPINRSGANTDPANWVNGPAGFPQPGARLRFLVTSAMTFASASTVAENNEVFCLTCHKAHGASDAFATTWTYGGAGGNNTGCQQCHNR